MIFETYTQRKKLAERSGAPDIYAYDTAPEHLRRQLSMTFCEGIGAWRDFMDDERHGAAHANEAWEQIDRICAKEIATYAAQSIVASARDRFCAYLQTIDEIDDFLSAVEVACFGLSIIDQQYRHTLPEDRGAEQSGTEAIREVNHRFLQHGVGYQFENGQIIRVDSKLHHAEVVKPALALIAEPLFAKTNADFMAAHSSYRAREFNDCATATYSAFESMLKAICENEGWTCRRSDGAAELTTLLINKGVFSHDVDGVLTACVAMIGGIRPSVRENVIEAREHAPTAPPRAETTQFALNLTAAALLFIGESYRAFARRKPA